MAVVQREDVILHVQFGVEDFEDFRSFDYLKLEHSRVEMVVSLSIMIRSAEFHYKEDDYFVTQLVPRERNSGDVYCVFDESSVIHQLVRSEGADGIQEKVAGGLEVTDGDTINSLIHLEAVSSVPIAAFFDEAWKEIQSNFSHFLHAIKKKNIPKSWTNFENTFWEIKNTFEELKNKFEEHKNTFKEYKKHN